MDTDDLRATAKAYADGQDPGEFDNPSDRVEDGYEAGFSAALAEVRKTLTEQFAPQHYELDRRLQDSKTSRSAIIVIGAYLTELEYIWDTLSDQGYADRRPFRED